ncbi:hypothetical protein [Shimia marina]|uniref:DUF560 domain-containing protein n=1 Tax=Shimia marina TaxID=321267 RepID=A0A0P1ERD4_9RHOB|nr:hypothetical protein [Shimia marina]CUH53064.1 hypothetical protein SHM7688_02516 [Shimia marina]SFD93530.1 hypothetical protein SAMN04488037_103315 [Shimia marina]
MKKLILCAALWGLSGPSFADERLRTFHAFKLARAGHPISLSPSALALYGQLDTKPSGSIQTNILPVFGYDSNLNGGVPHTRVDINGVTFTVLEQDRAVAGFEAGLSVGVRGQYFLAKGHRLSGAVAARYEQAISHDIASSELIANACYHYDSPKWTYGEACLTAGQFRTELSETESRSARVTLGRVLDTGRFPSALQMGFSRNATTDADYDQILGAYKTNTQNMTFELGAASTLRSTGFAPDHSIYTAITRPIFKRPVTATLRYSVADGGTFLGLKRREEQSAIQLSLPVSRSISLNVSYANTRSNLAYFRKKEITAGFVWRDF